MIEESTEIDTYQVSRCLAERMPYSLTYPRASVSIHLQAHPSSWFIVIDIPSGKHTKNDGKSPFFYGKTHYFYGHVQ